MMPERRSLEKMLSNAIDLAEIAQILNLIARRPNRREKPKEGDLVGDYDEWFDGGAVKIETGYTVYAFPGGTIAHDIVTPKLCIRIYFANGTQICVSEE
jgi:hypothetical protein